MYVLCFSATNAFLYYIKVSGIPSGNKLIKTIRYDIFTCEGMISSHVKISMISLISSLSFTLYLNSLVYHRNIFGSSSKVFGNLRKSSEILGKCSGTFVWPSEQFLKVFGNLRKVVRTLRKIIKNAVISTFI